MKKQTRGYRTHAPGPRHHRAAIPKRGVGRTRGGAASRASAVMVHVMKGQLGFFFKSCSFPEGAFVGSRSDCVIAILDLTITPAFSSALLDLLRLCRRSRRCISPFLRFKSTSTHGPWALAIKCLVLTSCSLDFARLEVVPNRIRRCS